MTDEYKEFDTVREIKENFDYYSVFKYQDIKFEMAGNCTDEYLVMYKGEHVETFSLDIMELETLKKKINKIKSVEPESMEELLNS